MATRTVKAADPTPPPPALASHVAFCEAALKSPDEYLEALIEVEVRRVRQTADGLTPKGLTDLRGDLWRYIGRVREWRRANES